MQKEFSMIKNVDNSLSKLSPELNRLVLSLLFLLLVLALLLTGTGSCFFADGCFRVGAEVLSFCHVAVKSKNSLINGKEPETPKILTTCQLDPMQFPAIPSSPPLPYGPSSCGSRFVPASATTAQDRQQLSGRSISATCSCASVS